MATLAIQITNTLKLKGVPPELKQALMETLEFPNPKWLENERMGRWNRGVPRVLKFYDKVGPDGLGIPRGYLRQLILLCRRMGVDHRIEDRRRSLPAVDFTFRGQLRPFQEAAVSQMLARDFGTLSSPTGSGKTVMALCMIARRRQPAVIVVHTKDLASQWVERIGAFLGIPAAECGLIAGGRAKVGDQISVALVQSLYKCAEEVSERIGFVVVDECHRCPSRTFTEAVTGFDSKYMLGLSATPWRRDSLSRLIFWHLGDVHHEVDTSHLVATGAVLAAEVIVRKTGFRPYHDPVAEYSQMLSELTADTARNLLIAEDVAREARGSAGICLVLSDRKAHIENLQALLRFRFKVESELLTGDMPLEERQHVVERLNAGRARVVIATGQLIGEGFDCPKLSTLFMATPVRFSGRVIQYLGRVLRPAPGKEKARVFDYVDVQVETLVKAAQARQRVYRRT
jgi:superfamily II DNA or RNA helicase